MSKHTDELLEAVQEIAEIIYMERDEKMNVDGGDSTMNTICLGCGDDMFANVLLCEVCWNGD